MKVSAFKGASNSETYVIKKNGVEFDLNVAGVTKVEIVESGMSIDSTTDSVNFNGSSLTIKWGDLGSKLITGKFSPFVYFYQGEGSSGEIIFGPTLEEIELTVVKDERS